MKRSELAGLQQNSMFDHSFYSLGLSTESKMAQRQSTFVFNEHGTVVGEIVGDGFALLTKSYLKLLGSVLNS